uniref:Nucleoid-associated protein n=1 Tax=Pinguiococcus pyrenoidosus TaxID=172671 RepID=A0A7R9UA45_9STRA|mmetsp:Transcript_2986/g.12081  ORF Transcript_2986/g.12081 Transcript_2986/m.12081 type:complete len:154 (+) Transcript_2986:96-557(+)
MKGFSLLILALCVAVSQCFVPSGAVRTPTYLGLFGGGSGEKEGGGGGGGGLGNMMEQMKQAQEIQKRVAEMQKRAEAERITGESSDGLVKVVFTGQSSVQETVIDDAKLSEGNAAVCASVTEAIRDGQEKCTKYMMKEAQEVYQSMGLPSPNQ